MVRFDNPNKSNASRAKNNLLQKLMGFFSNATKGAKVTTFVILIIFGGLIIKFIPGQDKNRNITNYTVEVQRGRLTGLVTSSGELKAERSVNISPERQGLLKEVYVKEGDRVKEGQLIAKMNDGDFVYRLNELKADYETQKASFERHKMLYKEGAISAEKHDESRNLFLKSKARLKQSEVEGSELRIKAPFSGLITARYSDPGAFVTPTTRASATAGATSTSIVELSKGLEVVAKVSESDISRIRISQSANVRVDAYPEKRFEAIVDEIAPRAIKTNNVTSFEVTLSLVNETDELLIGMTADVEFRSGETDISTVVPTVAIVTKEGVPGLLIVGKKQQPQFQKVELGTSSGSKTAILNGINPGDRIFIDLPPWAKQKRD